MAEQKTPEVKEVSVEARLKALYDLQRVVSEIDKIKTLRGELPLEVQDLEDEIAGLQTRIEKYHNDIVDLRKRIEAEKIKIEESGKRGGDKEKERQKEEKRLKAAGEDKAACLRKGTESIMGPVPFLVYRIA